MKKVFVKKGNLLLLFGILMFYVCSIRVQAAPAVPVLVSASASGTNTITVKWKKISDASGYRVYRKEKSGSWKNVKTITGNKTVTFKDTGLKAGTCYYYTVRAYKKTSKTTWSTYDKKGVWAITGLSTPGLVSAKHSAANTVTLKWKKVENAKGYCVYRKNNNKWSRIATVKSGTTVSYTDKDASQEANIYTVRAYTVFNSKYVYSSYVKSGVTSDRFVVPSTPTATPMPTPTATPMPTPTPVPQNGPLQTKWNGKTALVIGDSQSEGEIWQRKLTEILGMKYQTHALGGMSILQCIDGNGTNFPPLSESEVAGKDMIILFCGYNNANNMIKGNVGDLYPEQYGIAGMTQYAINKIQNLMKKTGNTGCRLVLVTPHCAGKNPYINFSGSEKNGIYASYKETADIMKKVAEANHIPCFDAYNNSGIGPENYAIYGKNVYIPTAPYPNIPDQLHLNEEGYLFLGTKIAQWLASVQ